jgi:hypothetical protein
LVSSLCVFSHSLVSVPSLSLSLSHFHIEQIERVGINEEGIFRLSGSAKEIESLKLSVNRGVPLSVDGMNVHTLAGLVKLWFRELPGENGE